MITLSDVAKAAGVSIATVSRTFSSPSLLKSDTYRHVLAVAKELNYIPTCIRYAYSDNTDMRSMQRDGVHGDLETYLTNKLKQNTLLPLNIKVCLAGNDKHDPIYTSAINGAILNSLQTEAKRFQIYIPGFNSLDELISRQTYEYVDVVVVIGSPSREQIGKLKTVASYIINVTDCPVRYNMDDHDTRVDLIAPDNFQGAYDAANCLIKSGHKRIGVVFDSKEERYNNRLHGYISAMTDAGLGTDYRLDIGSVSLYECKRYISEYLLQQGRPSALFAVTDRIAYDIIDVCRFNDINIPSEMSLIGFDDVQYSSMVLPPLTTVHSDLSYLGRLAARRIRDYQKTQMKPELASITGISISHLLKCSIVFRETVSNPAAIHDY